jgi:hypothetical protein
VPGPIDDSVERQKLASRLTLASIAGITIISLAVIYFSPDRGPAAQYVMTGVLPLLGSWVATVLAYYFARENLRAATNSVSTLMTSQKDDRLSSIPVKDKMIERTRIVTLSDRFKPVSEATIKDVSAYLKDRAVRRAPVLTDVGAIAQMVHTSTIDQFVRDQVTAGGKTFEQLKFSDLLGVPALKDLLEKSFALVAEAATLADAKAKMEATPNCEDVFVTKTGASTEPVIGWITDNAILEASK